jgi:2'-5' RNA ligase
MAYAISIRSENETSRPIRELWRTCSALEDSPSMEALMYAPHITFAVYDEIDPRRLFEIVDSVFRDFESVTIRFDKLGYFEAPHALILWAAPALPSRVHGAYERIHSKIDAELCRPNYRPGKWTPHCSLALSVDLSRKKQALALAARTIAPFEVSFDTADCVSFLPVKVLHERALRGV